MKIPPILPLLTALAATASAGCLADGPELDSSTAAVESSNGLSLNGMSLNGLSLNGMSLNGLSLNGLSLNGLSLDAINGDLSFAELSPNLRAALTGDHQEAALAREFLRYFGKCALEEGTTITIVPGVGEASGVGSAGGVGGGGIEVATADEFIVEPLVLTGVFGIAPKWPVDIDATKHRVASCLAGHVNPISGVAISLRASFLDSEIGEVQTYAEVEGAIAAMWGDSISGYTCTGSDNAEIRQRTFIREGGSGFVVLGECDRICGGFDGMVGYRDCGDELSDDSVISSFLAADEPTAAGNEQAVDIAK